MQSYKEMMLPILQILSDGKARSRAAIYAEVATYLQLTPEQLSERLTSGELLYKSRAGWGLTYLSGTANLNEKTQLVKRIDKGVYQITDLGKKIARNKAALQSWYQEQYHPNKKRAQQQIIEINDSTPSEMIERAYNEITGLLQQELLERIKAKEPQFFEGLVLQLLEKMGYGLSGAIKLTKNGADEGIDGIISEDELGLSKIYIQAKRWEGKVSRPEIQKFVGAISDKPTQKGVFITTSDFTKEARQYAANIQNLVIVLISGEELSKLMIKHKVGVFVEKNIELCKIDRDFFEE